MARNISHGRGGAGNIYSSEAKTTPQDLVTPTIKQDVFTTGRGGAGNMLHNDPDRPELAREMQDVEAPIMRHQDHAPHHTGRGGAANQYIPTAEDEKKAKEEEEQLRRVITSKSVREPRDIEEGNGGAEAKGKSAEQ
ncbi:DUF3602 domain-containing protein [Aspergillus stella-maris]|uniref:DUF3602 domain-containing protein n=1 Tax=Aspergillus stella-maris TaxID=1810926 RepID=UPI003CCDC61E